MGFMYPASCLQARVVRFGSRRAGQARLHGQKGGGYGKKRKWIDCGLGCVASAVFLVWERCLWMFSFLLWFYELFSVLIVVRL